MLFSIFEDTMTIFNATLLFKNIFFIVILKDFKGLMDLIIENYVLGTKDSLQSYIFYRPTDYK